MSVQGESVTVSTAAELLGTARWNLVNLIQLGRLRPARKLPGLRGAYLWSYADLLDAAERLRIPPPSPDAFAAAVAAQLEPARCVG